MIYNKNQIVSIQSFEESLDMKYVFMPEKKGVLGFGAKEEGIYINGFQDEIYLLNNVPLNHVKRGNRIYFKPRIVITYSNSQTETIFFNSKEDREAYLKKEFYENNWRRDIS